MDTIQSRREKENNTQKNSTNWFGFLSITRQQVSSARKQKKILQKDCDDITYTEYMKISAYTIKEDEMALSLKHRLIS